jgi:ArsR family transcriptional regulator
MNFYILLYYIDNCQYIKYASFMATRKKPAGCCTPANVERLSAARLQHLALTAKALADTNRLKILQLVASQDGPLCACDLVDYVGLSQPTVSHHLKVLREAGLLRAKRNGLWMFYSLDPKAEQSLGKLVSLVST